MAGTSDDELAPRMLLHVWGLYGLLILSALPLGAILAVTHSAPGG